VSKKEQGQPFCVLVTKVGGKGGPKGKKGQEKVRRQRKESPLSQGTGRGGQKSFFEKELPPYQVKKIAGVRKRTQREPRGNQRRRAGWILGGKGGCKAQGATPFGGGPRGRQEHRAPEGKKSSSTYGKGKKRLPQETTSFKGTVKKSAQEKKSNFFPVSI